MSKHQNTKHSHISQAELKELLDYDPITGAFKWRVDASYRIKAGALCNHKNRRGYICINIKGSIYRAHRLAWLYMTGDIPEKSIDHINGKRNDNRIANLRLAENYQNSANQVGLRAAEGRGLKGAYFKRGKWESTIKVQKKTIYLGRFETELEAHNAYVAAAKLQFGEFANHGEFTEEPEKRAA